MSSQLGDAQLGDFQLGGLSDDGTLSPGSATITYTGGTPTLTLSTITLAPGADSIAYTGGTPTLSFSGAGNITLTPGADAIVYTGGTPNLSSTGSFSVNPGADSIVYIGGTPVVNLDTDLVLYPTAQAIVYTGGTPVLSTLLSPGAGTIIYTAGTPSVSLVRTGGTGNQLYIDDVLIDCGWNESTFRITKTLSGEWSAEFDVNNFAGALPNPGQSVTMIWDSVKRWGGLIQTVTEESVKGDQPNKPTPYSILHIRCGGYQLLTDRVIIAKLFTVPIGGLPGIIIYEIWNEKLTQFGVTKIGDAGPAGVVLGDQLFHYVTVTEAFNAIKAQTPGWDWWIDDNLLLHYESTEPTGANAPFAITNLSAITSMKVTRSDSRFRNKQWVLPAADVLALRTDSSFGNGSLTNFATVYSLDQKPIVTVDSGGGPVNQIVTELGNWITGWQFYYIPGGPGVFAGSAPGAGAVVAVSYPNPFPLAFSAQDDSSIAAVGLYEAIWQSKNVFDQETAEDEAAGLLELYGTNGAFPEEVEFQYDSEREPLWLAPGMIIDVNKTYPTALGLYTVEQVDSQEEAHTIWRHSVKLRKGLGDVTDTQALQAFRTIARVGINSPPYRLTFEVFKTLTGATNPGAAVGVLTGFAEVQTAGVIASWDGQFLTDPPTGDDLIMDILLNGVSIFAAGEEPIIHDGNTAQEGGYKFVTDNIPVGPGDVVTLECLQVGDAGTGKDGVFHLNIKVTPNVASA